MKICFLLGSLGSGGAERTVQYLSKYGVENGYDVDVVTLTDVKFYNLDEKVNYYPLDCYSNKKNPIYRVRHIIKRIRMFRKYIKKNKPDLIYPILHPAILFTFFISRKNVIIGSDRGNPNQYKGLKKKVRNICFKHCDGMIYQTSAALKYYKDNLNLDGVVINNAVGNPIAYEYDEPCKNRFKKFSTMGRLTEEKDYTTMLCAFDMFYNDHNDYILEIYGEGDLRESLNKYKDTLMSKDAIYFMGAHKDALRKIYDSTGFLFTSVSEGMPNALMEAMAIGLPCISTDCPNGPSDLIDTNVNGILLEMKDVTGISNAMSKIIDDKSFANIIAKNAMKIKNTHSVENVCKKFYSYFEYCINLKKGN